MCICMLVCLLDGLWVLARRICQVPGSNLVGLSIGGACAALTVSLAADAGCQSRQLHRRVLYECSALDSAINLWICDCCFISCRCPPIHPQDGDTPLHLAALCGKTACATMLMEAGASRDIKNNVSSYT